MALTGAADCLCWTWLPCAQGEVLEGCAAKGQGGRSAVDGRRSGARGGRGRAAGAAGRAQPLRARRVRPGQHGQVWPGACLMHIVAAKPRAAAWLCGVCASATAPQQLLPLPWSGASPAAAEQSHRLFASCSAAEPYAQASCAPALGTYAAAPGAAPVRVPCP